MKITAKVFLLSAALAMFFHCSEAEKATNSTDDGKLHKRILSKNFDGDTLSIKNIFPKPIEIYLPKKTNFSEKIKLLIHFHGASYVPKAAVEAVNDNIILTVVNLGIGSSVYEKPFLNQNMFPELITKIDSTIQNFSLQKFQPAEIYLSSFSAGYGAVRRILQFHTNKISGVLLMDGMHTDYIPDATELKNGGKLNEEKIDLYLELAKMAIAGEKSFLISHSDIYPVTYASNRETADYLLEKLNLKRKKTDELGPVGMHKTSEVSANNFFLYGFDGDTARDHVDHYHAMPQLLCTLLKCKNFSEPIYLEQ